MSEDDSSRKDNNENRSVLNTVLNTNNTAIRIIRSFSIPPDKLHIYLEFCNIARREAGPRGFSEVVLKAFEEYNKRHRIGNPQLLMTHYVKPDEPQPMRVLCIYCEGAISDGRIFCRRRGMWIPGVKCYSCKSNMLRK